MRHGFGWIALGLGLLLGCNSPDATYGPGAGGDGAGGGQGGGGQGGDGQGGDGQGGSGAGQGDGGPQAVWAKSFGDVTADQWPEVLAMDSAGNLIVTGYFDGVVDMGGRPLPATGGSSAHDVFLAKLDPSGKHSWSRGFGGVGDDRVQAMAASGTNIVIAGTYQEAPPSCGATPLPQPDGYGDIFVAVFSEQGTCIWGKGFGVPTELENAYGVALDASQNVLLTGSFKGALNFGETGESTLTSTGDVDIFVAKLDAGGKHLWSKGFGDAQGSGNAQEGMSIAADDTLQRVIVGGSFDALTDFGQGPFLAHTEQDMFLVSLQGADGGLVWQNRFVETGSAELVALKVNGSSSIMIAGNYSGSLSFGDDFLNSEDEVETDIFVAKLDAAGEPVWAMSFGGPGLQQVTGMDIDANGDLFVTGFFRGTVDFGDGPLTGANPCLDMFTCNDGFLIKLDAADGSLVYSRRISGEGNDFVEDVAIDPAGAPTLFGSLASGIDFGNGVSVGEGSFYLARFE